MTFPTFESSIAIKISKKACSFLGLKTKHGAKHDLDILHVFIIKCLGAKVFIYVRATILIVSCVMVHEYRGSVVVLLISNRGKGFL